MSEATPTRSVVLEMRDERRAMHDGYVFLDEKCLLLAGEMLRQLERYDVLQRAFATAFAAAIDRLQDAIARHGLHGLEVYPGIDPAQGTLARTTRVLMGVSLQEAELARDLSASARALDASPEAEACRRAFTALSSAAAPLAANSGNLARLSLEYKRSVRRARALQDVLLPELDRDVRNLETRLEELEQEDAIWMRHGRS